MSAKKGILYWLQDTLKYQVMANMKNTKVVMVKDIKYITITPYQAAGVNVHIGLERGETMITLTELFCLYDEWEMWTDIEIVAGNGKLKTVPFNIALSRYGSLFVERFDRYTVYVREEQW